MWSFIKSITKRLNAYPSFKITIMWCKNRPPLNLLRQEISGTTIYLEILHKSTSKELNGASFDGLGEEKKLKGLAEEKLVSFCGNVLREASDLQPNTVEAAGSTTGADIHRVLDLRAPIIVKVHIFLTPMHKTCFSTRSCLVEAYTME